jgi:hypothetical protein
MPASFEESRRGLTEKTPNQFTLSNAREKSVRYFNTNTRSDGDPFDPARTSNMSITIAAPNTLADPLANYSATLLFNSGRKDALSVAFAPSFDANSGIAYGSVNLRAATLVGLSVNNVIATPEPPKWCRQRCSEGVHGGRSFANYRTRRRGGRFFHIMIERHLHNCFHA